VRGFGLLENKLRRQFAVRSSDTRRIDLACHFMKRNRIDLADHGGICYYGIITQKKF